VNAGIFGSASQRIFGGCGKDPGNPDKMSGFPERIGAVVTNLDGGMVLSPGCPVLQAGTNAEEGNIEGL
jgi:hypothetical protein